MENYTDHDYTETADLVLNAINKFKNHLSIIMIKIKNNPFRRVSFSSVQRNHICILSKFPCGFRKGYNAQPCLTPLIKKWKQSVNNGGAIRALMTDLLKEFDCLSHELLIAKLDAFDFDKKSLQLVHNYLSNRKQRNKINHSYSFWREISHGIPQVSILGPLLFNISICNMFYFLED